jgi:hypothetical protein
MEQSGLAVARRVTRPDAAELRCDLGSSRRWAGRPRPALRFDKKTAVDRIAVRSMKIRRL